LLAQINKSKVVRGRGGHAVLADDDRTSPAAGEGPGHSQVRVPGPGDRRPDLLADRRLLPDDLPCHRRGGRRGGRAAHHREQHRARDRERDHIPGWLDAPAHALAYPFHTFIGGHLTRLGTRDDVTVQQQYIADLKAAAANAIDTFDINTVYASVDDTNPWAIFRGYLDGVAAQASDAVVPNWIDKLGGADVYTQANAYQLVESLRIDYGHLGPFGIHP
jgi:hypothetical protein